MGFIDFYERVKVLVKSNKTTIEYTVNQAGLKLSQYNSYRSDKKLPRGDEVVRIAEALGTTAEYLVTGESPEIKNSDKALDEFQAIIDKYRKLGSTKKIKK